MGCTNTKVIEGQKTIIESQAPKKQEIEVKQEEIKQPEPPKQEILPVIQVNQSVNVQVEANTETKQVLKAKKTLKKTDNIIWLDPNIDNIKNSEELKSDLNELHIKLIKNINDAIEELKRMKSNEVKIILSEEIYNQFIQLYKANLIDMSFSLTIFIFKPNEENSGMIVNYNINNNNNNNNNISNNNNEYKIYEENLYEFGGIIKKLEELLNILNQGKNESEHKDIKKDTFDLPVQLTFDIIDSKAKLLLPLTFKTLIDNAINDDMIKYSNSLFDIYSKQNFDIRKLLGNINSLMNISSETLSKYYAQIYTIESNFYRDINEGLRLNNPQKYMPYIRTLYEGVRLKTLPLANDDMLYRGTSISKVEIEKIKDNLKNKIENLPGLIAFSKPFLSFTKERHVAEGFIKSNYSNTNLINVLFVLEKDNDIGFNLSTHCDLENLSYFKGEREVLFFPFSSFEIKGIKQIYLKGKEGYEIKLLYLGKYLKDIENDADITLNEEDLPDSEFKKQLIDFGLIKKEKIEKLNPKKLIKQLKKFEKEINNNTTNSIKAEINIGPNEINKDIQIINSYENYHRIRNIDYDTNDDKNLNEKEIKENIEIKINGKSVDFTYLYKFGNEGVYNIEYIFKKYLTKTNYMFADCKYITHFDFSNFISEYVENMSYMFSGCESLVDLDLANFNTENVTNMNFMFYNCNSLKNLNISNFNTQNVTQMKNILSSCDSLINLKSSFQFH